LFAAEDFSSPLGLGCGEERDEKRGKQEERPDEFPLPSHRTEDGPREADKEEGEGSLGTRHTHKKKI
jgi:hypothetical protein